MVFAAFAVPSDGQFTFGLRGHIGVVIGGIKKKAMGRLVVARPEFLQESFADLLNLLGGESLPFFPVALG